MKNSIDIRELKKQLRAYVRRVRAGETFVITNRGKPVGRLVPYSESLMSRLEEMQKTGFISWSGRTLPKSEPTVQNKSSQLVSDLLIQDRR